MVLNQPTWRPNSSRWISGFCRVHVDASMAVGSPHGFNIYLCDDSPFLITSNFPPLSNLNMQLPNCNASPSTLLVFNPVGVNILFLIMKTSWNSKLITSWDWFSLHISWHAFHANGFETLKPCVLIWISSIMSARDIPH